VNQEEWLKYGWQNGFCTAPVCSTHDGVPFSSSETDQFDQGYDDCTFIVRLYADLAERKAVEAFNQVLQQRELEAGWAK
jgi:hypothetical protein